MNTYSEDEHINIGSGKDIAIIKLARLVCEVARYAGEINHDLTSPDGTPRNLIAVDKLHALGWSRRIGLRESIAGVYRTSFKFRVSGSAKP